VFEHDLALALAHHRVEGSEVRVDLDLDLAETFSSEHLQLVWTIFALSLLSSIVFGDEDQLSDFAACRRSHVSPVEHPCNGRSVERLSFALGAEAYQFLCSHVGAAAVAVVALCACVFVWEEVESRYRSHAYD
jgi:hypothetical protein